MTRVMMWFRFLFLLILLNLLNPSHGKETESQQDLELLLSFKASIHDDPLHSLSNWLPTISLCNWNGITCNKNISDVIVVTALSLAGKNISGEASSSVFHLPNLTSLDLSNNQLTKLLHLDQAPPFLSPIRYLNLSNNNLTGPPPRSLFSASFSLLETLDLSNNMFSGEIPPQIGLLSALTYLDIGGNLLGGHIPSSITQLKNLQYFTLASNQLVGEIPKEIRAMKNLKWIYFGYNNLSGEIPSAIGELTSLNHLDLVYNNLTGAIPESIGSLTNLEYIFLYQNKFNGPIPRSIFNLKKLVSLDLSDNSLSGEIPELVVNLQRLEILHLFSNNFSGKIPKGLESLPRLQVLQLWSNSLTGEIPLELGKRNNLTVLDLSSNNLTGKVPETLCNSGTLYKLILFSNKLEGRIPRSLSTCKTLRRVRLQNNKLSGNLPEEFTKLTQVYFLDISGNQLSGRIDDRQWSMPSLQMLNLANNFFSGEIPSSFGSKKLEDLDLSENRFSGEIPRGIFENSENLVQLKLGNNNLYGTIPEELCSCKKLVALDLSHNNLNGQILMKLAEMPVLGLLDLSENQFSGEIPQNLGKVESLVQVNISHNRFHGGLPSTGAFLAINASAVAGNDLCDRENEASNGLPPCKGSQNQTWLFLVLCLLFGLVAIAVTAFLVVLVRRRKSMQMRRVENNEDGGTWEMQFFDAKASRTITMEDVVACSREGKVVSKGRNWVSYEGKCMGSENDMRFLVKEITDATSLPLRFWEDTVKFEKKVRHGNIVKLVATCHSGKKGFLVYESVEGERSLAEIVSGLSWQRRWKVAVGIAKALKFLHCECCSTVWDLTDEVLSPEIVLVDGKGVTRLKLSPPGMAPLDVKGFMITSPYVAPEARNNNSGDATEKSEIYGFGVMLIELLTGRATTDIESGNGNVVHQHQSVVEWARYCYSDCHLDTWIDPVIKGGDESTKYHNDVVEAMNLALHCTATDPKARPSAREVLKALEAIHATNTQLFCST
ncbi:hypothetical protein HN51_059629 [Arachis hypogaea]|uniref:Protein kinase domain-containing protein n=1 Tax=Arachis hypogaea TaxID=3818 RepID=A0A444X6G7_ARAHY|nr:probably inactive leucine-rich repeat receptor-like protein kinase At2g25790 [Arachis ipaensis]XP_025681285.1 probably inactive leucine-rich repeat receptor-like protein kinase At2g25790 [Arachis hypogaea]QHN83081.1 putative inactive leucine-rich repeat receptor-like protein kinase [Arachis hypogaea]QHN83082.1 putative inactive leucine-rich repeat receptor-like protein kinase [Arachis hypogaea]RYQ85286.1 hypothetical protein Ahy_B10g104801 [Arachis hypogaea]